MILGKWIKKNVLWLLVLEYIRTCINKSGLIPSIWKTTYGQTLHFSLTSYLCPVAGSEPHWNWPPVKHPQLCSIYLPMGSWTLNVQNRGISFMTISQTNNMSYYRGKNWGCTKPNCMTVTGYAMIKFCFATDSTPNDVVKSLQIKQVIQIGVWVP